MVHRRTLTLWCIAILFLIVASANAAHVLELVQVVHRTGVVVPNLSTPNRSKMCSPNGATSCDAIANLGVQQVTNMGAYIKGLYDADKETTSASTWFSSPYNPLVVESHSVGEPATVQAAGALLRGIYAAPATNPVILSSVPGKDTLLDVTAYPSIALANEAHRDAVNAQVMAIVDKQFPDPGVLAAMGAEVGVEGQCSGPANRVPCCLALADLAATYAATNQAAAAPTVMGNRAKLDTVAAAYLHAVYGYSTTDAAMASRGSFGQPLAQQLLENMRGKMAAVGSAAHNAKTLMQYTHRVPVGTALGHGPSDLTPVAEAFVVDLLRDSGTGAFSVRLRYATAQTGNPAAAVFPFRCVNEAGVFTDATTASGITCPFDDFARFVDSTKGTDADGLSCYLDEKTRAALNCQVQGAAPSAACAQYRAMCPARACPDGFVYDLSDGSCGPLLLHRDIINNGVMGAVCFSIAFAGFVLGIVVLEIYPVMCRRVKSCLKTKEDE